MKNFAWILLVPLFTSAQQIIPEPVSIRTLSGSFALTKKTVLLAKDAEDNKTVSIFNDYLQQVYGFKLAVNKPAGNNFIQLTTLKFIKAPEHEEGYSLNVTKNGVTI